MPPTCTLPSKNAGTTAPTSYSKAPDSPFLRFSKATSCPGPQGRSSWTAAWLGGAGRGGGAPQSVCFVNLRRAQATLPSFGALIWGKNKGTAGPGLPGSQQQVGLEESEPQ